MTYYSQNSKSKLPFTKILMLKFSELCRVASHMEFNFPKKEGTGIGKLIPNVSAEA